MAAVRKYLDRRDKALANIVLGVSTNLLYLIPNPQDPEEVWDKLCNQFQKKTWANKLALRRRLYGLRLKDQESVQHHIKSMIEIFDHLDEAKLASKYLKIKYELHRGKKIKCYLCF